MSDESTQQGTDSATFKTRLERQLPVKWENSESAPIIPVNVFVSQATPDGIIVSLGFATPPLLQGTPEEVQAKFGSIDEIRVTPDARLILTPARFKDLIAKLTELQTVMETMDDE